MKLICMKDNIISHKLLYFPQVGLPMGHHGSMTIGAGTVPYLGFNNKLKEK